MVGAAEHPSLSCSWWVVEPDSSTFVLARLVTGVIAPGAIDKDLSVVVRYCENCPGFYDRSRLSPHCTYPGWRRGVLPRRPTRIPGRRPQICVTGPASGWVWKPDAYAGAASRVRPGSARDISANSWWLGKNGAHSHSSGLGERGCTRGCTPNCMEAARRHEH